MMTFGELQVGQYFDLGIDADGYEPIFYKLNDHEAYQVYGLHSGSRADFKPGLTVNPHDEIVDLSDTVTEIERAALTLVTGRMTFNPRLGEYAYRLANEPNLARRPRSDIVKEVLDWNIGRTTQPTPEESYDAACDIAVLRLAYAIATYRIAGRPAGDQHYRIDGLGGPLVVVNTSLAAAVVDYHLKILVHEIALAVQNTAASMGGYRDEN